MHELIVLNLINKIETFQFNGRISRVISLSLSRIDFVYYMSILSISVWSSYLNIYTYYVSFSTNVYQIFNR